MPLSLSEVPSGTRVFDWTVAFRADARWQARPWLSLRSGVDLEWDRYVVNADLQSSLELRQLGPPITQELRVSHSQPLGNLGEFAEAEMKLGRWELHPGLRFDQFHWREHTYGTFDPRLWARYAIDEATAIKGYAGAYHQAPNPFNLDPAIGNPSLTPERAWQELTDETWEIIAPPLGLRYDRVTPIGDDR